MSTNLMCTKNLFKNNSAICRMGTPARPLVLADGQECLSVTHILQAFFADRHSISLEYLGCGGVARELL